MPKTNNDCLFNLTAFPSLMKNTNVLHMCYTCGSHVNLEQSHVFREDLIMLSVFYRTILKIYSKDKTNHRYNV